MNDKTNKQIKLSTEEIKIISLRNSLKNSINPNYEKGTIGDFLNKSIKEILNHDDRFFLMFFNIEYFKTDMLYNIFKKAFEKADADADADADAERIKAEIKADRDEDFIQNNYLGQEDEDEEI